MLFADILDPFPSGLTGMFNNNYLNTAAGGIGKS